MSGERKAKLYTCSHDVSLDTYCWMCDYQSRAILQTKHIKGQKDNYVQGKTLSDLLELKEEIPSQMSLDVDEIKQTPIKSTLKGPLSKSQLPSYIKIKSNEDHHLFHLTPRATSFHLNGYAVVPFEEWKKLDQPFFRFIIKITSFFKRIMSLEKFR